jgi:hypothetical protein
MSLEKSAGPTSGTRRSRSMTLDATRVLVLPSRSQRELILSSRREKRCARGLIGKPCRQPEHQLVPGLRLVRGNETADVAWFFLLSSLHQRKAMYR